MSQSQNDAPKNPEPQEPLSEQQLDELSGGLNPQPLPPCVPPPELLRF